MTAEKRCAGRPSTYGFDAMVVGQLVVKAFKDIVECERIRRSALAHARRNGKVFRTARKKGSLHIKRIS